MCLYGAQIHTIQYCIESFEQQNRDFKYRDTLSLSQSSILPASPFYNLLIFQPHKLKIRQSPNKKMSSMSGLLLSYYLDFMAF